MKVAPFVPAVILLITWLLWISAKGGYFPDAWYPSTAGVFALLIVTAVASGRLLPELRVARVALLAFAALVALNYLSILWAGAPGDALEAANKLALYLAVAWTISILPWTPRTVAVLLGAWSLGVAVFCAVGLAQATGATQLDPFFDQLRYATPLQYSNATAALAVMGMWPALILSAQRAVPGWIRALLLAIAVFLTDFAFLPQSRGALAGMVLVAPVVLAVSSDRLALLARMVIVGAGLAVTLPRTVHVDTAITAGRHAGPALQHAASAMLATSAAALILGGLLVLAEARWHPAAKAPRALRQIGRRPRIALVALSAVAIIGAGVVAAPEFSRVTKSVSHSGRTDASTGSTRLLSVSPEERFDYVRVAARLFTSAPVLGVGGGNFGRRYDALRRFPKHSQYVHDLALRTLSENGIVGLALLITVIAALAVGLVRARKELGGLGRACSVAALAVAAYFLIHDSLDWLDEFPALAAPALALPLAAIVMRKATTRRELAAARSTRVSRLGSGVLKPPLRRAGLVTAIVVADVALALVLGAPYLEMRYVERAFATFTMRPTGADHDLARAASLNPLSAEPLISAGTIAVDLGDANRARSAFEHADRREDNWYSHLELGLLDARAGQFALGLNELSRAASLDASDPVLTQARTLLTRHQRVDPLQFNQLLVQGAEAEIYRKENIR